MRLSLLFIMLFIATPASAQLADFSPAPQNPEARVLYERLLKDPDNRPLTLRYAALAARLGDYEAAIPPLERLLLKEPDNSWLMLQLGTLYRALNSPGMAHYYYSLIIGNPSSPPERVEQAKQAIKELSA